MDDSVCQSYFQAVLSYAPVTQWRRIIDFVENESVRDGLPLKTVHKLLACDCYFSLFDRQKAIEMLKEIDLNSIEEKSVQILCDALNKWILYHNFEQAFDAFVSGLDFDHTNLFFCKRAQLMALLGGFNEKILIPPEKVAQENKGRPYFAGILSFGYEQANRFIDAEKAALEGLGPNSRDGWLDHSYAHSLYFQGQQRIQDAKNFLESRSKSWSLDDMMPFLYTHLWWHYALVLLESGEVDEAIEIFDRKLWPEDHEELKCDVQVQINALELLWKLETLGKREKTLDRWESVIQIAKARIGEHDDLLHDILLLRGCAAANNVEGVEKMLSSVKQMKNSKFEDLCTSVAEVCLGKDKNEIESARRRLRELEHFWPIVGNSTEQRAIFLEMAHDSPVVCGRVA